jgi:hypothetical protein
MSAQDILIYFLPKYIIISIDNYMGKHRKFPQGDSQIVWRNFKKRSFRPFNKAQIINYYTLHPNLIEYTWIKQNKLNHVTKKHRTGRREENYFNNKGETTYIIEIEPDGSMYRVCYYLGRVVKKEQLQPGSREYLFYLNDPNYQLD